MKHIFTLAFIWGYAMGVFGQLNGTYTINPSLSASTSNYKTFAAAVFDLTQNSGTRPDSGTRVGPGVSGPVTFLVAAGTYTEQISITPISGASATNTITFTSATGVPSSVLLQFSSTSSAANYTVQMFGADFIRFQRLSIFGNNSTFPVAVRLANNGSDHAIYNTIRECRIKSGWGVTTTNGAITSNGNNTGLEIVKDTFSNAMCGIYFSGNNVAGSYTDSVRIDSNFLAPGSTTGLGGSDCFYGFIVQFAKNLKMRANNLIKNGCCADKGGNLYNLSNKTEIYNNQFYITS